ncbi:substrate-binding periplasmic protein [Dongia rigui]|uniref:Transporter substrate-binding domain-containing protein n=1 Tax=Dongia rigui TaxID=940149 RepID=A0ABU5DV58_9PROT|nr:transporter substrate-binding domain-containing protein [Dongia rigui]MDY0871093.1 transporter substrate-binding domain-containing protein [Dongia rigui]
MAQSVWSRWLCGRRHARSAWFAIALAAMSLFGQAAHAACSGLIASGNPDYPPYLWRDPANGNRLIGANAALMTLLSQEIGLPIEVRYISSWARVQEEMKNGRIDLIAGAFLTQPRLDYMDYVHPIIATTRSVVITREDSRLKYAKWPDLVAHKGVTVINNSFGEAFDRYAKENLKIEEVGKLDNALQLLSHGRADYLVYEDAPARAFAARLGIKHLKEAKASISNEDLYLTLSHRSACNDGAMRGKLAKAMMKFRDAKVMDGLIAEAIKAWQGQ